MEKRYKLPAPLPEGRDLAAAHSGTSGSCELVQAGAGAGERRETEESPGCVLPRSDFSESVRCPRWASALETASGGREEAKRASLALGCLRWSPWKTCREVPVLLEKPCSLEARLSRVIGHQKGQSALCRQGAEAKASWHSAGARFLRPPQLFCVRSKVCRVEWPPALAHDPDSDTTWTCGVMRCAVLRLGSKRSSTS